MTRAYLLVLMACAPAVERRPWRADSAAPPTTHPTVPADGRCAADPQIAWLSEPAAAPLADGDPVVLVNGHQGGWHVALNAGVASSREVEVQPTVVRVSTGEPLAGDGDAFTTRLLSWDPVTCEGLLGGVLARFDGSVDRDWICALAGERLAVHLDVVDLYTGAAATRSVEVHAVSDARDACP